MAWRTQDRPIRRMQALYTGAAKRQPLEIASRNHFAATTLFGSELKLIPVDTSNRLLGDAGHEARMPVSKSLGTSMRCMLTSMMRLRRHLALGFAAGVTVGIGGAYVYYDRVQARKPAVAMAPPMITGRHDGSSWPWYRPMVGAILGGVTSIIWRCNYMAPWMRLLPCRFTSIT